MSSLRLHPHGSPPSPLRPLAALAALHAVARAGLTAAGIAFTALGCGGGGAAGPPPAVRTESAARPVDRYFPLEEGRVYQYVTHDGADTGMLVARVHRTDATHGELRMSNATKRFVLDADGVRYDTGAFLLRAPLDVGTSWPGEHGGTTRIVAVDAEVKVPAGQYAACVRTIEEGGRPPNVKYTTTYCPGVGMVLLEVAAPGAEASAELKSYAPPVIVQ